MKTNHCTRRIKRISFIISNYSAWQTYKHFFITFDNVYIFTLKSYYKKIKILENQLHKMKVSFDYDGTLTKTQGIDLLQSHIAQGDEVYIITRRRKSFDEPVYETAKKFGVPKSRVYFTNGEMKWKTILELGIELHYDNNENELILIDEKTDAETILIP